MSGKLSICVTMVLFVASCGEVPGGTALTSVSMEGADLAIFIPDLGSSDSPRSRPGGGLVALSGEVPPDSAPAAFDEEASIISAALNAGLTSQEAYAIATTKFFANQASTEVSLNLLYTGIQVANQTRTGEFGELVPLVYEFSTAATIPITGDCGHSLFAGSDHKAWHEWAGVTWSLRTVQRNGSAIQPGCPDPGDEDEGGGGGDEGGSGGGGDDPPEQWYICFYTEWYDAETGEYLGSEFHGCVPI